MANAGYIIVKNKDGEKKVNYRSFYGPHDKGSAKPSFCYPKMKESLKEEVDSMQRALDSGYVDKAKELQVKADLKLKKTRLSEIESQEGEAKKLFKAHKDDWMKRRNELAEEIRTSMPSEKEVEKKRVNPHRIFEMEKKKGLGEKKLEFQVLSRLADEESNTKFLQREA